MDDKTKFDHWPLVEGASILLRRHVSAPDDSDSLEFGIATGSGEADGVKFDITGTAGCNLEVCFEPEGAEYGTYRYFIDARDVVVAAHEQFIKDRKGGTP